ncbi:hypothetical protein [Micromonospora maris]|uniref:hypothetical protein n=1 Tax=Micromonospora maris TaxID=1003110 RepID=UPI000206BEE0|nr:hypothetical protein [Micromonospora maris]AEB42170.1 hypothetical protein VAB18032_05220 [Micromonospora maris AB-18-032]
MTLTFEQIPDLSVAAPEAPRSRALTRLRVQPQRRTVLRGIAFSALAVGGFVASATSRFSSPAHAETGPGGLTGWDRNDCKDAFPNGYSPQKDNVGSHTARAAACFGGAYRGSTYCASGWHRSGTVRDEPVTYTYKPVSNSCGATTKKNAWRWTTPDGVWWRCSDGNTTVSAGGTTNTYFTICRY